MEDLQPRRGPGRPPKYETVAAVAEPSAVTIQAPVRPARKPFGAMQQKLAYAQRENYHRHWFNDTGDRIHRATEAGYDHVKDNDGKNVSYVVGTTDGGQPLRAFLMEIPEEWYQEDMAAQQREIDAKEASIKSGQLERQSGDGRYVPSQGISIKRG